jgi:F0F1-type ATP synthase membrane subunit b/b'
MMRALRHALPAALLSLASAPALAAGGHGDFTFTVEGFYILDFVILVALLWYLLAGPARRWLAERHDRVKAELEAATNLRLEAERRLAEVDALLSGLTAEVAAIREQFRQDGEREAARIAHEATVAAERHEAGLARQLGQEQAKVRETLERELVSAVLKSTEEKLKARLDGKAQANVTAAFLGNLENMPALDSRAA